MVNLGQMSSKSIKEWAEKRLINLLELQPLRATLELFYFYCTTFSELLRQFRQSLAITLPIALDIAL